ncbi:energy transducer TonB [uncultured Dokdonia sp.]|uniref:energy transducer TonB n=1 Tax=uncultured Dokdonia sp. TaxID=575653 RepID=UPI002638083F|nr:energy transducer TonB [uncultured Dokdonia sp.]
MRNSQESKDVRQNIPYAKSRKHEANLRRNPTLHFQIGLILSLFVAILFIEMRMPTKAERGPSEGIGEEDLLWSEVIDIEPIQVDKITQKEPPPPQQQQPEDFTIIDDEDDLLEEFVDDTETNQDDIISDNELQTLEDPDVDVEDIAPIPVNFVQKVPIFPGCEGLNTNQERKDCMSSKISKIINRKFDTELGEKLGLTGVNKIFVQFTINKEGVVTDMKARGPHEALEKEAKRVIGYLPKMTPGKQGDKSVGVIYSQPITFQIQD